MNPFATTTTASTALPSVALAAMAIHNSAVPTPQPPLTAAYMVAPTAPVSRFKTLLNVAKERFGD